MKVSEMNFPLLSNCECDASLDPFCHSYFKPEDLTIYPAGEVVSPVSLLTTNNINKNFS